MLLLMCKTLLFNQGDAPPDFRDAVQPALDPVVIDETPDGLPHGSVLEDTDEMYIQVL